MSFRRIHHFVHTAELGSLSRAAERLHIVQPALSQSIRRLEDELGVSLFTRSRRGMELTEAGNLFLKSAYGILNQYNRAKENISAIGQNPMGLVSVAMTASALNVLSIPISEKLTSQYPDIELNLDEGLAADIQQGFEAGLYDLVVSYLVKPNDSIHIEGLIEEDMFLTTAYDKTTAQSDIPFRKLSEVPLILPQDQHGIKRTIDDIAHEQKITLSSAPITTALHPTLQLVEAGFGSSLLPWSAIHDRIASKKLSARKVVRPKITHIVSMIHPSNRPLTQATIAVMDILRQSVSQANKNGKWLGKLLIAEC